MAHLLVEDAVSFVDIRDVTFVFVRSLSRELAFLIHTADI